VKFTIIIPRYRFAHFHEHLWFKQAEGAGEVPEKEPEDEDEEGMHACNGFYLWLHIL